MLSMRELSRVYRTDTVETTALDRIDLEIGDGEFVAIMGPSGCGKSTLLNVIGMLDSPSSGSYMFAEQEVGNLPESKLADIRKRHIGFIFQSFNLIDELSVRENIELALLYHEIPASERKQRVEAVMDKVGIAHRGKHRPSQLSGGQQQRVAVARAVVGEPKMILADEPTGNLDSKTSEEILALFEQLYAEGQTIILVTHEHDIAEHARRQVHLKDGKIERDVATPGRS